MHPVLQEITARITARSAATRQTYLDGVAAARDLPKGRDTLSAGTKPMLLLLVQHMTNRLCWAGTGRILQLSVPIMTCFQRISLITVTPI